MAKLLPPYVDGKLPAQSDVTTIKIPFRLNRAVGREDFNRMAIKIKDLNTNQVLSNSYRFSALRQIDETNYVATFSLPDDAEEETLELESGKHYKVQLAFVNKFSEEGYYSTVGIFKLGTPGTAYITNLVSGINNVFPFYLKGEYSPNEEDMSEKAYSYYFQLYKNGQMIEDSGEIFTSYYELKTLPEKDTEYKVQFSVLTINGFTVKSIYTISYSGIEYQDILEAKYNLDEDDGSIIISCNEIKTNGNYRLFAESSDKTVRTIGDFYLTKDSSFSILAKDYGIADGETYTYSLYLYDNLGRLLVKNVSKECKSHFDDIFLSDNEKQYCIKYNPQVSSFKTNLLESKQETLGAKYPAFFRNNNVGYKEFSIGGLISRLAEPVDDAQARVSTDAASDDSIGWSTNLTSDNFAAERKYKLEMLNWLNNGKPKLFRSPAEGNYYVRLMNVSLSPNTTLGRMLHSFTATAYEVADINKNLFNTSKIIYETNNNIEKILDTNQKSGKYTFNFNEGKHEIAVLSGSDYFSYVGNKGDILSVDYIDGTQEVFIIGSTGQLTASVKIPIIKFSSYNSDKGTLTYSYYEQIKATAENKIQIVEFYNSLDVPVSLPNIQNNNDDENNNNSEVKLLGIIFYCDEQSVINKANTDKNGFNFYYQQKDDNKTFKTISLGEYKDNNFQYSENPETSFSYNYEEINELEQFKLGPHVRARIIVSGLSLDDAKIILTKEGNVLFDKNGLYLVSPKEAER